MNQSRFVLLLPLFLGCSSGRSLQNDEAVIDGGSCVTSIEGVQARISRVPLVDPTCPQRFDDIQYREPCADKSMTMFRAGPCGSALLHAAHCRLYSVICVYDVTSRLLVGAATSTDTNAYCGGATDCISGGILPAEVTCGYGLRYSCPLPPVMVDATAGGDAVAEGGG
jgi:hypothetical protein